MKIIQGFCLCVCLFGLVACGGADENGDKPNNGAETTQTDDQTPPKEDGSAVSMDGETAQQTMLEAINQWRGFVDESEETFAIDKKEYKCEGWGGSIVFAKENGQTRAITVNSYGEHGHSIDKFYFDENDELVLVFSEEGNWIGNTDYITRTLYYVDDNAPFFAMHKAVEGAAEKVEKMIADKEFEETELNINKFSELVQALPEYEKLSENGDVQAYFCQ